MKYIKLVALIGLFSILITSCGKKSKLGKLIPKEAAVIVDINAKSLLSKLPWDEIKQTSWYNELMSDSSFPATGKTFLGDPAKTGIDMGSDIVFFVVMPGNNGHAVVEGSLKDSKAFSDFIKSMHPAATISKDGDLDIFKTDEAVIGWNSERFVFVTNANHQMHNREMNDSTNTAVPLPRPSPDSLLSVCKNIFSLKSENSLYENEKFAALEKEEGDIHFWVNINEIYKGSMKNLPEMMAMVKLDKFLEGNISTATINFEDGKVSGTHKQYFGKELSDILKKGDGNINTDMIKRISPQNLAGIYAIHFTPANLLEIIKLTGIDGFINLFMAQGGVSLDDVVKGIKGDILFAVNDITMKDDTTTLKVTGDSLNNYHQQPGVTFLFALAIGDKDAFNKLLKLGNGMQKELTQKNIFQKSDDKYFVVSNSQDAVNKYFSGAQSTPDFLSKINDHPHGAFVDIQMILKGLQAQLTKDSMGKVLYDRNIAMWNNVYVTGGDYKDGGIVMNAELNLIDKNTNSLKQLNKYIDNISKVVMEEKKKNREKWGRDSTIVKTDSVAVTKKKPRSKTRK
ncbi:MAG: hypothetical protein JWN83_315 [Chitinophagaceae bacterium]|nr:hypothetical protein [Chitinophagaceae bacterium]